MRKLVSALAGVAVLGLAAGAFAQSSDMDQSGTGGSGSTSDQPSSKGSTGSYGQQPGSMTGQQQLEGKVLKADKNSITIEHMGAAIPLAVQSSTSFQGVKSATQIKEGQQVRANFELKGTKNELTSVEVLSGAGGTGSSSDMGSQKGSSSGY